MHALRGDRYNYLVFWGFEKNISVDDRPSALLSLGAYPVALGTKSIITSLLKDTYYDRYSKNIFRAAEASDACSDSAAEPGHAEAR